MHRLSEVYKKDALLAFEYIEQAMDAKYPDAHNEMGCYNAHVERLCCVNRPKDFYISVYFCIFAPD